MGPRRHACRRTLARAGVTSAVLLGGLAGADPAGAAVTIGSDLSGEPTGVTGCVGGPSVSCVVVQRSLPNRLAATPIDGVMTKFRIRGGSGTARVRVVRPGPAGFIFATSSPYVTGPGTPGITEFPAQLPMRKGDFVGADAQPGAQAPFRTLSGATADYYEPSPADGATATPNASPSGIEFMFNADVEPDGDGDGFGDETQDGCPGNGSETGPCPPPEPGKSVNVEQVKGTVLVRIPGQAGFTELTDEGQIPVGAVVDVTKGTVRLTSAADLGDKTQTGDFYDGVFKVGQKKEKTPITELTLAGDLTCGKRKAQLGSAAKRRRLWGRAKGRFRTRGRRSSAAVRGTTWLVEDRCDGTLTRVKEGSVTVRDFRLKRDVIVKAGKSYLAS